MRHRTPPPRPPEPGGNYLIAVGDVMAGLVFVFILTALAFALQLNSATASAEAEKKDFEIQKAEADKQIDRYRAIESARSALLEDLERALLDLQVEVVIDKQRGVLRLPEDVVRFETGDHRYQPRYAPNVERLSRVLLEVLPCFADSSGTEPCVERNPGRARLEAVFVEGHSDSRPYDGGRYRDNLDLSAARAHYTYEGLKKHSARLLELLNPEGEVLFGVSGYGKERPLVLDADDDDEHKQNRRIDLRFIMAPPETAPNPPAGAVGRGLNEP